MHRQSGTHRSKVKMVNLKGMLLMSCFLLLSPKAFSQNSPVDQKVFLITLDGFRWQELFNGADKDLIQYKNM
ncbi:MAG: hypothetical protein CMC93_02780 [Flavobacteriaceae bacterium]|nr:hypothetical protein [Flavobacteriaceae bacterium]|tara:strand:+ start:1177 stop:1392 length:216 start_codon:yes stop_codon:yes gene_type:complete